MSEGARVPVLSIPQDGDFIYAWLQLDENQRHNEGELAFARYRKLTEHVARSSNAPKKGNGEAPPFELRSDEPEPRPQSFPLNWSELAEKGEPPARRWAINGWLGFGHVSLLVGPGGIGKTLISQQLASCLALGRAFVGDVPESLTTLMWCAEDDHDELWRRQLKIAAWQGVSLNDYTERLILEPRAGLENALVESVFGRPVFTNLMQELRQQAEDYRADVVILDNVAQMYGANENERHSVTVFINALVGALPGRAILLLAHPSRGLGSEFSGSSAWENCARTRLYLGDKLPDAKEGAEVDSDVRFLSRRKANYSSKDYRRMEFHGGVLIPDIIEEESPLIAGIKSKRAPRVILECAQRFRDMGVRITDGATSPHFMPRIILDYKLDGGGTKRELSDAMRQAMLDHILVREVVGQHANRTPVYGLVLAPQTPAQTPQNDV